MELYQLKTFITVAREGHLTRAAERLHTSQPAVSAHIKALEEELGVPLFDRTAKGMDLTYAGSQLRARAEAVLQTVDTLRYEAANLKNEVGGVLRVGMNVNPHFLKVTEMLTIMRNTYPGIEMHFHQRMTWEAPGDLLAGDLDAAFVYRVPKSKDIGAEVVDSMELVIISPPAWRDRFGHNDWNRILEMPWVWSNPQCPYDGVAEKLFASHGKRPRKMAVVDDDATIKKLVISGIGLGMMIADEARELEAQGKVFIVGDPIDSLRLALIYLRKREQDPLLKGFLTCIRKVWHLGDAVGPHVSAKPTDPKAA